MATTILKNDAKQTFWNKTTTQIKHIKDPVKNNLPLHFKLQQAVQFKIKESFPKEIQHAQEF